METLLRALADDSRRTLLERLRVAPATVNELASVLPIARPGVSRHLRVLREAGLVEVRHDAQSRIYSLRPEPLAELDTWLSPYRAIWQNRMNALNSEVARGRQQPRKTSAADWCHESSPCSPPNKSTARTRH